MGHAIIIGAQWGDEGKGKIVDLLCRHADLVVRYQGGPNAGHTVSVKGQRTFLHHIPAGILHPGCLCLLGNGMVVDPEAFLAEIRSLEAAGVEVKGRLFLSDRAHLIFPHHRELDRAMEKNTRHRIGTTRKGVGYAYEAKVIRAGIRPADLHDPAELERCFELGLQLYEAWRGALPQLPSLTLQDLQTAAASYRAQLAPYVTDTVERIHMAAEAGQRILLEGSQGTLLDLDHGTYPFVTSSNTLAGAACAGAGIGVALITGALGVFKAYSTRVGEGPMPTETPDETGEKLRVRGHEFGTTTGRPRRCGWFDAVAGRYAARVNGLTTAALTLLDVLDDFETVRIATAYETSAGPLTVMPATPSVLRSARPVYETLPGWCRPTSHCRQFSDLPAAAKDFVERLENVVGVHFSLISVGPDRDQTIVREQAAIEKLFA